MSDDVRSGFWGLIGGARRTQLCLLDAHGAGLRDARRSRTRRSPCTRRCSGCASRRARRRRRSPSGIETPRGVLVDTLIEQGFAVFALNPEAARSVSRPVHRRAAPKTTAAMRTWSPMRLRTDRRAFRRVRARRPADHSAARTVPAGRRPAGGRRAARQSVARSALSRRCGVAHAQSGRRRAVAVDDPAPRRPHPDAWAQLAAAPHRRRAARAPHSPADGRRRPRRPAAAAPDGRRRASPTRSPPASPSLVPQLLLVARAAPDRRTPDRSAAGTARDGGARRRRAARAS